MKLEDQLRKELAKAVKQVIKPPVLVSPKWLRCHPKAKPPFFQYVGTRRIAKATGKDAGRIAQKILSCVNLESLGLKADVAADGVITFRKAKPKKGDSGRQDRPRADAGGIASNSDPPR